jgi:hypothetical protein
VSTYVDLAPIAKLWIDINKTSSRRTRLLLPPLTCLPPRVVNNYTFNGDGHAVASPLPGKKPKRRKPLDKAKKRGKGKEKKTPRRKPTRSQERHEGRNTSSN